MMKHGFLAAALCLIGLGANAQTLKQCFPAAVEASIARFAGHEADSVDRAIFYVVTQYGAPAKTQTSGETSSMNYLCTDGVISVLLTRKEDGGVSCRCIETFPKTH